MKTVTFDKEAAAIIMQALDVKRCHSCLKKIKPEEYGGSLMIEEGPAHFHSNVVCLLGMSFEIERTRND